MDLVNGLGKAVEEDQRIWDPATHVPNLNEVPESWLRFGSTKASVGIWRVNSWMEGLSVSVSPFLSLTVAFKLVNKYFTKGILTSKRKKEKSGLVEIQATAINNH